MSIRTTRCRISLPGRICSTVNFPFATRVSSPAAHSKAEPWAMSKKRQRSLGAYLPLPSAMFSGTDVEARSKWVLHVTHPHGILQNGRKPCHEGDRLLIHFEFFMVKPMFIWSASCVVILLNLNRTPNLLPNVHLHPTLNLWPGRSQIKNSGG